MTTDTILTAAQWGYACYHQGRSGYAWDRESFPVTRRWELVAALVLNGNITTGKELRTAYLDGYLCKDWSALGVHDRKRWGDVLRAMQRCAREEAA